MTPENHIFTLTQRTDKRFVGAPIRYRSECLCGWTDPDWRTTPERARAEGYAHKALANPKEAA